MEKQKFATLISTLTNDTYVIKCISEGETALDNCEYETAINKISIAWKLSKEKNDPILEEAIYSLVGIFLIESMIPDINKAYQFNMKQKAIEISEKIIQISKSQPDQMQLLTLMRISDIVKHNDVIYAKKIDDMIAESVIKGLQK